MSTQVRARVGGAAQRASDRVAFVLLCLCVAAQGYSLPIWPIGPSWAVWPTPPILVAGALIATCIVARRPVWPSLQGVLRGYVLLFGFCLLSFGLVTVAGRKALLPYATLDIGFPLYHIWIMLLAGGSLWAASTIHLDERRARSLRRVTLLTLLWVCVTVGLTYHNFVPTRFFAPQLPLDEEVSGAFYRYLTNWPGSGLGTIGYNHAYAASVILILTALWMHLLPKGQRSWLRPAVVSLALLAVFLTGSRAGFAGFVLFFGLVALRERSAKLVLGTLASVPLLVLTLQATDFDLGEMLGRQATILERPTTETLSERDLIWQERLHFLDEDKVRWIIGTGFGSASASGDNAHMLYLHIIVETGLIGLLVFAAFFLFVLRLLWRLGPSARLFFIATVALLFSSLTQETLYPVPAKGFTLPLYLIALAIVVRSTEEHALARALRAMLRAQPRPLPSGRL